MSEVKIIPMNERVLVEPIQVENKTLSGLVISAGGEEKIPTTFATILAVNENLKDEYKVGEVVYFREQTGVRLRLFGKHFTLLLKNEILAKIEIDKKDLGSAINSQDLA